MVNKNLIKIVMVLAASLWGFSAAAAEVTLSVKASGGKYYFDNERTPVIEVEVGDTLVLETSDRSLRSHPFYITTNKDSGVTFTGAVRAADKSEVRIEITKDTPKQLFYSCSRHRNMGGNGFIQVNN
tara:strand:- start:237 stop:617 length:381 start_codon:yes stop_codon:yes gene_type:complete